MNTNREWTRMDAKVVPGKGITSWRQNEMRLDHVKFQADLDRRLLRAHHYA
jgi:hypothetical protein